MLRSAWWALRQPRYAALAAFMLLLAAACAAAGTWQISRYEQKVRDNNALRANAHAAAVPLTTTLLPIAGTGRAPGRDAIRYRTVQASGSYLPETEFLGNQSQNGADGFWVLSPLRTGSGVLLVVRGFVASTSTGTPPTSVPSAPAGSVQVTGRLQTPDTSNDRAGSLPAHELVSINPRQQAARLGAPVYDGYLTLAASQPGGAGLQSLAAPDLSNPAGGAQEWQHLAYIVQWYVFALLALAAPFAISRHEVIESRRRYLGIDAGAEEIDADVPRTGELVVRSGGELVRTAGPTAQQVQRAAQLADRYGRSLGRDTVAQPAAPPAPERPRRATPAGHDYEPVSSKDNPYRSPDGYHGAYNDYLWQLALADGNIPAVSLPDQPPPERPDPPLVIDAPTDEVDEP